MFKFDTENHTFESMKSTVLKDEKLLERYDLQKTIINSWEEFRNEIGYPEAFLIGQEINPHNSTQNAIDLLAFNQEDSSLIVIELKRDKNKLQLLQALSYAAMVAKWDQDELISKIQTNINPDTDELINCIKVNDINSDVKIILISEFYAPEVIITADWLNSQYSVDITAFAVTLMKLGEDVFLTVNQRYPLKELSDAYESRLKRKKSSSVNLELEWEDILPKLKYPFAERGIELCKKIRKGDPSRRRFGNLMSNYDGFTWISMNFRTNYIRIYIKGDYEDAEEFLQSKFRSSIEVNRWRDGLSFIVDTESKFEDVVKWLKLG